MKNKANILKNVSQRATGENLNKELLKIAKANGGGEEDVKELRNFYYKNIVENEEKRNAYFSQKPKERESFSFVNFKKQLPPEPKAEKSKTKEAQKFEEDKRKRRESFFKKKEKVKREVLAEAKKKGVNITPKTKTPKTPKAKKAETGEFKGSKKQIQGMMEKLKEFTPAAEGTVEKDIVWESLYFNGVEKLGDVLNSPDYSKVKKVYSIDYPNGIDRSEISKMEKDLRTFIYKTNADNDKAREKGVPAKSGVVTGFFISGNAMFIIYDIDNSIELSMLDNFIDTKGYSIRNF